MNNLDLVKSQTRNRSLFVVEGEFEKNVLFRLISKLYPELSINFDNVWIYRTNIHDLYETIKKYYETDRWDEEDVDLPFILSDKLGLPKCRRNEFTSIILIFDYERQDTFFDPNHIKQMQMYFNDSTNAGKLYINYPMVESLWDFETVFDTQEYEHKFVSSTIRKGREYKNSVKNTPVAKAINLPKKFYDLLVAKYDCQDTLALKRIINEIFELRMSPAYRKEIETILSKVISTQLALQASFQLANELKNLEGFKEYETFWSYLKSIFRFIIFANIRKASFIQLNKYDLSEDDCIDFLESIDESLILDFQNIFSNAENGVIWVLNTCLFLIPDYNPLLIKE